MGATNISRSDSRSVRVSLIASVSHSSRSARSAASSVAPSAVISISWRRRSSSSGLRPTRPRASSSLIPSVSDCTRTCRRAASSAGVVTSARLTSPSTCCWLSVRPLSLRWRRSWRVRAMIDSRSSVALAVSKRITKLYLGNCVSIRQVEESCFSKGILVIMKRWAVLVVVTIAVTVPLTMLGVPVGGAVRRADRGNRAGAGVVRTRRRAAEGGHRGAGRARRLHRHDGAPGRVDGSRVRLADRGRRGRRHAAA